MSWLYTKGRGFELAPGLGEVCLGRGERVIYWYLKNFYLREKEDTIGGAEREGERDPSRLCVATQSATWGSFHEPWDHDLSQNQESDAKPTEPPRRPGILVSGGLHWHNHETPFLLPVGSGGFLDFYSIQSGCWRSILR